MKINVEVYQVVEGHSYNGTIEIGAKSYDWTLRLSSHIADVISGKVRPVGVDASKRLLSCTVKDGVREFQITNEMFAFLLRTTITLAMELHQHPQTEHHNHWPAISGGSPDLFLNQIGLSSKIGMKSSWEFSQGEIPHELRPG